MISSLSSTKMIDYALFIAITAELSRFAPGTAWLLAKTYFSRPFFALVSNKHPQAEKWQKLFHHRTIIYDDDDNTDLCDNNDGDDVEAYFARAANAAYRIAAANGFSYFFVARHDCNAFIAHKREVLMITPILDAIVTFYAQHDIDVLSITDINASRHALLLCSTQKPISFLSRRDADIASLAYARARGRLCFSLPPDFLSCKLEPSSSSRSSYLPLFFAQLPSPRLVVES